MIPVVRQSVPQLQRQCQMMAKRNLFTAIRVGDFGRLQERLKMNPKAVERVLKDGTTPLHYLAGACPSQSLRLPVEIEPPRQFTRYLLSKTPPSVANAQNAQGETSLHVASRVGYSNVVKQLLGKGLDPNANLDRTTGTPLHAAFSSTVFFDPALRIPLLLARAGADIHARDGKGRTPLFALYDSVKESIDHAQKSQNPLHNDLGRIEQFHLRTLPKKMSWLIDRGAQVEEDERSLLVDGLKDLDTYDTGRLQDRTLRPVVSTIIPHSKIASTYRDGQGWSLLHWAAYKQCSSDVIHQLQTRGLSPHEEDRSGVTPNLLALMNLNGRLLRCFTPGIDVDQAFNRLEPHFFGDLVSKLPARVLTRPFTTGLPQLLTSDAPQRTTRAMLQVYSHASSAVPHRIVTMMGKALEMQNIEGVKYLIDQGWNASIDLDFASHYSHSETSCPNFADVFHEIWPKQKTFAKEVLELFNQAPSTGITLSNEFDHAVMVGNRSEYIRFLLEAGLTPELYQQQTGRNLQEEIRKIDPLITA